MTWEIERAKYIFKYTSPYQIACLHEYQLKNASTGDLSEIPVSLCPYFENLKISNDKKVNLCYVIDKNPTPNQGSSTSITTKEVTKIGLGKRIIVKLLKIVFFILESIIYRIIPKYDDNPKKTDVKGLKIFLPENNNIKVNGRILIDISYDITIQSKFENPIVHELLFQIPCIVKDAKIKIIGDPRFCLHVIDYITEYLGPERKRKISLGKYWFRKDNKRVIQRYININKKEIIRRYQKYYKDNGILKSLTIFTKNHIKPFIRYNIIGGTPIRKGEEYVEKLIFPNSIHYRIIRNSKNLVLNVSPWLFLKPGKGIWYFFGLVGGFFFLLLNGKFLYELYFPIETNIVNSSSIQSYIPLGALTTCIISSMAIIRGWVFTEAQDQLPSLPFWFTLNRCSYRFYSYNIPKFLLLFNNLIIKYYNHLYAYIMIFCLGIAGTIIFKIT